MSALTHRDFFLDILYDAGRTTAVYEDIPAIFGAWQRLIQYGAPRDGGSFFENTHLHLTAPAGALQ